MPNLLRFPAVLIALLFALYWAFGPTPSGDRELASEQQQDKLVLRMPAEQAEPDPPLPPAKERRKGPRRAAIRAQESHQLTSAPSTPAVADDETPAPIRAHIRGITPLPNEGPASEPSRPAPTPESVEPSEPRHLTHVIVDGDDLKRLASKYLGNAERFYEIFEANPDTLQRPDVLPVGKRLRIPLGNDGQ